MDEEGISAAVNTASPRKLKHPLQLHFELKKDMNSIENSLSCLPLIHVFWEICSRSAGQIIRRLYGTPRFITALYKPVTLHPTTRHFKPVS